MKSILTLSMLFAGIINASAQLTYSFPNNSISGEVNTTLVCEGTCTNTDCCIDFNCTQSILGTNLPQGWTISMTNPNGSHPSNVTSDTFVMNASSTENVSYEVQTDGNVASGTATVRLELESNTTLFTEFTITATSSPTGVTTVTVDESVLSQNYPNPMDEVTYINYNFSENINQANLQIMDATGKVVAIYPVSGQKGQVTVNADLPAGNYIYSLVNNGEVMATNRMQKL